MYYSNTHFFVQHAATYCTWGCKQVCQVSV